MKQGNQIVIMVALFGGFILVYSGIKNVNPIELMKNTLQGKGTKPIDSNEFEGSKGSKPGGVSGTNPSTPGRDPYGTPTDIPRGRYGNGAV